MAMGKKDSSSKRSVPSPQVESLREALGQRGHKGYGSPEPVQSLPHNLREHGGKGGAKGGIKSKVGYDVKTRVAVAKSKKK